MPMSDSNGKRDIDGDQSAEYLFGGLRETPKTAVHAAPELITSSTPPDRAREYCAKPIWANIPEALKNKNQWVCWDYVTRVNHDGSQSTSKEPRKALSVRQRASSTRENTWSDYDTARDAYLKYGPGRSDGTPPCLSGVGFVLARDRTREGSDTLVLTGLDIDKCVTIENGEIKIDDEARQILENFRGRAYIELSPSLTGVRIICRSKIKISGINKGGREIYTELRYLTLTGQVLREFEPVSGKLAHDCTDACLDFMSRIGAENKAPSSTASDITSGCRFNELSALPQEKIGELSANWWPGLDITRALSIVESERHLGLPADQSGHVDETASSVCWWVARKACELGWSTQEILDAAVWARRIIQQPKVHPTTGEIREDWYRQIVSRVIDAHRRDAFSDFDEIEGAPPVPGKSSTTGSEAGTPDSEGGETPPLRFPETAGQGVASAVLDHFTTPGAIPPRPRLYGKQYFRREVGLTFSPGGLSKSTLVMTELVCMALGRELLGEPVFGGPLRVCYVNLDDSEQELARRLAAIFKHYQLSDQERRDCLSRMLLIGADTLMTTGQRAGAALRLVAPASGGRGSDGGTVKLVQDGWDSLEVLISGRFDGAGCDCLCLDPLNNFTGAIMSNEAFLLVAGGLYDMAVRADMSVQLVHHERKAAAGGDRGVGSTDSASGGAALVNRVRSARQLVRMTEREARDYGVPLDERGRYVCVLEGLKQNYMVPMEYRDWYRLESVDLANAGPFSVVPSDSVGVMERWVAVVYGANLLDPDTECLVQAVDKGVVDPQSGECVSRYSDHGNAEYPRNLDGLSESLGWENTAKAKQIVKRLAQEGILERREYQDTSNKNKIRNRTGLFVNRHEWDKRTTEAREQAKDVFGALDSARQD